MNPVFKCRYKSLCAPKCKSSGWGVLLTTLRVVNEMPLPIQSRRSKAFLNKDWFGFLYWTSRRWCRVEDSFTSLCQRTPRQTPVDPDNATFASPDAQIPRQTEVEGRHWFVALVFGQIVNQSGRSRSAEERQSARVANLPRCRVMMRKNAKLKD